MGQSSSFAATVEKGFIQSLEELIQESKNKQDKDVIQNPKITSFLEEKDLKIDIGFLKDIFLYTPRKYTMLFNNDNCTFFSLLETNHLRTKSGEITKIPIVSRKNESILLPRKTFLQKTYNSKCFINKEYQKLFSSKNFSQTLKKLKLKNPINQKECQASLESWKKNPHLPYVCSIAKKIQDLKKIKLLKRQLNKKDQFLSESLKKKMSLYEKFNSTLNEYQKNYITSLCNNFDHPEKFCRYLLVDDTWGAILNGTEPKYKMEYLCKTILKKQKIIKSDYKNCSAVLRKKDESCMSTGVFRYPALFPKLRCKELSTNLKNSQLITRYQDCPGNINNNYIINTTRIIQHFTSNKDNKLLVSNRSTCASNVNSIFAKMYVDFGHEEALGTKVCYTDKIKNEKKCKYYVAGDNKKIKKSETAVVGKMLHHLTGAPKNEICKISPTPPFNKHLLRYQAGCHITYNSKECSSSNCPKTIYYNKSKIKGITYEGSSIFEYFPINYVKNQFAIVKVLENVFKIKSKKIHNLAELTFFLDLKKTNIIHGIGCLEDIHPESFIKRSINQCTPLPFILDGYRKFNNQTFVTTRSAIEDIHSPRQFNWNRIYTAVANYKNNHPLRTWTLYGLRKKK